MAEVLQPYDVTKVNRTLGIDESRQQFEIHNGPALLKNAMLDLFAKYSQMAESLCVVLVHHHFKLGKNEALVDVNDCSTAWNLNNCRATPDGGFEKYGGRIRPRSWLLSGGKLVPFEFYFDKPGQTKTKPYMECSSSFDSEFAREFISIAAAHNLTEILGLSLHRTHKQTMLEVNEPVANISFPENESDIPASDFGEAGWGYEFLKPENGDGNVLGPFRKFGCKTYTKYLKEGDGSHTSEQARKSAMLQRLLSAETRNRCNHRGRLDLDSGPDQRYHPCVEVSGCVSIGNPKTYLGHLMVKHSIIRRSRGKFCGNTKLSIA